MLQPEVRECQTASKLVLPQHLVKASTSEKKDPNDTPYPGRQRQRQEVVDHIYNKATYCMHYDVCRSLKLCLLLVLSLSLLAALSTRSWVVFACDRYLATSLIDYPESISNNSPPTYIPHCSRNTLVWTVACYLKNARSYK
jgi:hypothetical protein